MLIKILFFILLLIKLLQLLDGKLFSIMNDKFRKKIIQKSVTFQSRYMFDLIKYILVWK